MSFINVPAQLFVDNCSECGIMFAYPHSFFLLRRKDGEDFYCPNGHLGGWFSEDEREQNKKEKMEKKKAHALTQKLIRQAIKKAKPGRKGEP